MAQGDILQNVSFTATFGTGSPTPVALSSVPAGSLILVISAPYNTFLASCVLSTGETPARDVFATCNASNRVEIYSFIKVGTGVTTVTPTCTTSGDYYTGHVLVIEGPFAPTRLEASNNTQTDQAFAGGNTALSGSVTTAGAAIVVASMIDSFSSGSIGLPSGSFTERFNDNGAATHNSLATATRVVSAGGSYSTSWLSTAGDGGQQASAVIAAYKFAAAGGGSLLGADRQTERQPRATRARTQEYVAPTAPPVVLLAETRIEQPLSRWLSRGRSYSFDIPSQSTISGTIGMVTEIDTAQPFGRQKARTIAQAAEADSALQMRAVRRYPIALVTETDLAQAMARAKRKAISQVAEADSALAMNRVKARAIGLVSETDVAQAMSRLKRLAIAQVSETDTALGFGSQLVGQLGLVTEADSAFSMSRRKQKTMGLASETDSAQPLTSRKAKAIALVVETDAALALQRIKRRVIGEVLEVDSAFALAHLKRLTLGLAVETDTALALVITGGIVVLILPLTTELAGFCAPRTTEILGSLGPRTTEPTP